MDKEKTQRSKILEHALKRLLEALDKQCFPPGSGGTCDYSLNVEDAIRYARSLVTKPKPEEIPDPADIARPKEGHGSRLA